VGRSAGRAPVAALLAAALWLVTPGALAGAGWLLSRIAGAGRADLARLTGGDAVFAVTALAAATVGVVVAARRPRHPVGWLLSALGATMALAGFLQAYAVYGVLAAPGSVPWAPHAAIVSDAAFAFWLVLVALTLYLTPTGRPLSPRWRVLAAGTAAAGVATFLLKLVEVPVVPPPLDAVANPWELTGLAGVVTAAKWVALVGAGGGLILGGVSLLVRFRRAVGVERRQMTWVALAVAPMPLFVIVTYVAAVTERPLLLSLASAGFLLVIPVGIGLAVLQYKLYEVDRIASRATTYLILTGLVAAVYAMVVLVAARTLGGAAGGSPLVVSLATLAAVSIAAPARRFVQDSVDRRFNRRRFDALRMIHSHVHDPRSEVGIQDLLRQALGDPALRIGYWVEDRRQWVDAHGRPAAPGPDSIEVARHGRPIARVEVDPERVDRPLAEAALAAAVPELDNVGLRAAVALQLVEVRESRARIAAAQAEERRRIERNLHDGVQQRLLALAMQLHAAQLNGAPERLVAALDTGVEQLRTAVAELRELANGLHPAVLTDGGLAAALDDLAARAPTAIDLRVDDTRFARDIEATAWFVICEAVTNAVKHAGPARIAITAHRCDERLLVTVSDDGTGGADPAGRGLRGLADRAEAAGGSLTVHSPAGAGTTLTLDLPCG
jgi:signal transduction histidine kinase